ncbi:hypothetical protein [Sansalvadorimonas verongulae]|uniref:hypothetical protein n=1 Tax=Sansalvadorimonas verongulae TaxID=2172824 RepID=UPI0012BC78E2|nr:hypothetical protein [Sansalvadorimonas verongulae]MTI12208.1 hypothetical protein [Sansalvadorimonas verongulae]
MPLPIILAGLALTAGGVGIKKGIDAKEDFGRAKSINSNASHIYDQAKKSLENEREATQKAMITLGELKFSLFEVQLSRFVDAISKMKNVDFNDSQLLRDQKPLGDANMQLADIQNAVIALHSVLGGGMTALGAGGLAGLAAYGGVGTFAAASTGTGIASLSGAAATNATLAWLGGGSLASGGMGMAGGTMVLGGLVAGPVLAVSGLMLASKAEEVKENALANLAESKKAAAAMDTGKAATYAIKMRFIEITQVLNKLRSEIDPLLEGLVTLTNQNTNYDTYSQKDKLGVYNCFQMAITIKNVMETQLLSENGSLTGASTALLEQTNGNLDAYKSKGRLPEPSVVANDEPAPSIEATPVARKSFNELVYEYEHQIMHDGSVYCVGNLLSEKASKKANNAMDAYADGASCPSVLIDTTVFGSGKEGYYFTDDTVWIKESYEDVVRIRFEDINSLRLDEDDKELMINGNYYKYGVSHLNRSMRYIVKCLKEHLGL